MIEYEWSHLKGENRKDNQKLLDILHQDFKEFGKSGKTLYKEDVVNIQFDTDDYEIYDLEEYSLAEDVKLCTYTLLNKTKNQSTNRSSIWKFEEDWKLLFHQGTEKNKKLDIPL